MSGERQLAAGYYVIHPNELFATFIFPLPEPVGLPGGTVLPTFTPPSLHSIQLCEKSGLALQRCALDRFDEDGTGDDVEVEAEGQDEDARNWVGATFLSSSVLIHQVTVDYTANSGLAACLEVAGRISRGDRSAYHPMITEENPRFIEFLSQRLAESGAGAMTIVEVGVPLRLVGWSKEFPNTAIDWHLRVGRDATPPSSWPYIVSSPGSELPEAVLVDRLQRALDSAIEDVALIQSAHHEIEGALVRRVTRQRLPHLVPTIVRDLPSIQPAESELASLDPKALPGLLVANAESWPALSQEPLAEEMWARFASGRARADGGSFGAFSDLRREALLAHRGEGDERNAVLLLGIAAEVLFDELLLHLSWESCATPEAAAETWRAGLDARVRSDFYPRLGGDWSRSGAGAVADWSKDIASLRHRVAHAGYTPTATEAMRAFKALDALGVFLADRLASDQVRKRFPRTAIVFLGADGLKERRALTKHLRELMHDPNEPNWEATFRRFRETFRGIRGDVLGRRRIARLENSIAVLVKHPDGSAVWCLHDPEAHLVSRAVLATSIDALPLSDKARTRLAEFHDLEVESAVSLAMLEGVKQSLVRDGEWFEEYHLLPMAGVMCDQSDFQREPGSRAAAVHKAISETDSPAKKLGARLPSIGIRTIAGKQARGRPRIPG